MHVRVSDGRSSEARHAARHLLSTQDDDGDTYSRDALRDASSPHKRRMLTRSAAGASFLQFTDGLAPLDTLTVVAPAAAAGGPGAAATDKQQLGAAADAVGAASSHQDLDSDPTSPTSFGSAAPQQFHAAQQAAAQLLMVPGNDLVPTDPLGATSSLRVPTASTSAGLSAVLPGAGPLSMSQRGELELARHRAQKAAAGRKAKVPRPVKEQLQVDLDDGDDSDLDLSKLGPEERESLISATLANLDDGKDAKRLKRLLRNRVSAQQARERKKQYVTTLEEQVRQHQARVEELEAELKAAHAQNSALRKIIQSMQADRLQAAGGSSTAE